MTEKQRALREMRDLAINAWQVTMALPGQERPNLPNTAWPEFAAVYKEIKIRPTAQQISVAERFWEDFAAAVTDESERKEILTWLRIKCSPQRTIGGWCEKNGLFEHQYRRKIDKIFQKLVGYRAVNRGVRWTPAVETPAFSGEKPKNRETLSKSPKHWKDGNVITIDPDTPKFRLIKPDRFRRKKKRRKKKSG